MIWDKVNTLGTWGTCWEPIGSMMVTQWELHEKTLWATKIQHPHPPPKKKNLRPQGPCCLTSLVAGTFFLTCVFCHFLHRLTSKGMNHGFMFMLLINWCAQKKNLFKEPLKLVHQKLFFETLGATQYKHKRVLPNLCHCPQPQK
jgi:hypothetical protein